MERKWPRAFIQLGVMHLSLKCGVITPIHTSLRDWSRCDNPYLLVDLRTLYACTITWEAWFRVVVVVVVVFTLKAVPISTQYFLTSVLVELTRTSSSVVTG